VSQLKLVSGNSVDFSVINPMLRFSSGQSVSSHEDFIGDRIENLDVPLIMDAGLYSLVLEPITPSDPRYGFLPIFDVTSPGPFSPFSQCFTAVPQSVSPSSALEPDELDDSFSPQMWTTTVLSVPSRSGRVIAMSAKMDFDDELRNFSDAFLAPVAIPPARRQYDVDKPADMTELSIRFMGTGTDRILHTVGISNGLNKPPSKTASRWLNSQKRLISLLAVFFLPKKTN
jgi:hypothetical protein